MMITSISSETMFIIFKTFGKESHDITYIGHGFLMLTEIFEAKLDYKKLVTAFLTTGAHRNRVALLIKDNSVMFYGVTHYLADTMVHDAAKEIGAEVDWFRVFLGGDSVFIKINFSMSKEGKEVTTYCNLERSGRFVVQSVKHGERYFDSFKAVIGDTLERLDKETLNESKLNVEELLSSVMDGKNVGTFRRLAASDNELYFDLFKKAYGKIKQLVGMDNIGHVDMAYKEDGRITHGVFTVIFFHDREHITLSMNHAHKDDPLFSVSGENIKLKHSDDFNYIMGCIEGLNDRIAD